MRMSFSAADAARWSAVLFFVLPLVLIPLRGDLDPARTFISEYALGPYGWLMTLAFALWAASYAALLVALTPAARGVTGRLGLAILVVCIVGLLMAAVFQTDVITDPPGKPTTHGLLHGWGALLGGNLPLAGIFFSISLPRQAAWASERKILWSATAFAWLCDIAFIIALAVTKGDSLTVPLGWLGRVSIAGQCTWLIVVSWRASRMQRAQAARAP